jgi:hypothetical protein
MNDQQPTQLTREQEDAIFRETVRRKHLRQERGSSLYVPKQRGRFKPLIVVERCLRTKEDEWEVFTSTKNPTHAQNIVAEGANDAIYRYRVQLPTGKPCPGTSRTQKGAIEDSVQLPISPDKG